MEGIRDEALETILTLFPQVETKVIECMNKCSSEIEPPTEQEIREKIMQIIGTECRDEIEEIRKSIDENKISDAHFTILADFLMDGLNLFSSDEKIAILDS